MKKRGVFIVFLLSIVTLGIYQLVWSYKVREGLMARVEDKKSIPSFMWLIAPIIIMLATIPLLLINAAASSDASGNIAFTSLMIVIMLVTFAVAFIITFWWYYRFFTVLSQVTKANNLGLLYALWILAYIIGLPIWILVAQGDINKLLETDPTQHDGTPPTGPADPPYPTVTPAAPLS